MLSYRLIRIRDEIPTLKIVALNKATILSNFGSYCQWVDVWLSDLSEREL